MFMGRTPTAQLAKFERFQLTGSALTATSIA
jgi:hypothetical protein